MAQVSIPLVEIKLQQLLQLTENMVKILIIFYKKIKYLPAAKADKEPPAIVILQSII